MPLWITHLYIKKNAFGARLYFQWLNKNTFNPPPKKNHEYSSAYKPDLLSIEYL